MMNVIELVTVKRVCKRLRACFHWAESDNGCLLKQLCSPSSKLNNNNLRVAQFFTLVLSLFKLCLPPSCENTTVGFLIKGAPRGGEASAVAVDEATFVRRHTLPQAAECRHVFKQSR